MVGRDQVVIVSGNKPSGDVRGFCVAEKMGLRHIVTKGDAPAPAEPVHVECAILVKARRVPNWLKARRLILDPLDMWGGASARTHQPRTFWAEVRQRCKFDEIIATSPACAETMRQLRCPVHLLPHAANPLVRRNAYRPDGAIAHLGMDCYGGKLLGRLGQATQELGRKLLCGAEPELWYDLEAAVILILREPLHNTPLNRYCKPQIKLENAALAGCAVLARKHPCLASLEPENITWYDRKLSPRGNLECALANGPIKRTPITMDDHCAALARIIGLES